MVKRQVRKKKKEVDSESSFDFTKEARRTNVSELCEDSESSGRLSIVREIEETKEVALQERRRRE